VVIDEHGIILKLLPDLATVEGQQEILADIAIGLSTSLSTMLLRS